MPVEVLQVGHNPSDMLLIKDAAREFSSDAQTAVLLFDPGFKPQLVITDMHTIPGVNTELFKRAKAKGAPVVVFCSVLNPKEIAETKKLGAAEYVQKPILWDEFRNAAVGIFSRWSSS